MPGLTAQDANFRTTRALPSGAATVNQAAGFDTMNSATGDFLAECELRVAAPALTTGELGDTATNIYFAIASPNADLSNPTLVSEIGRQTGAGGAGAAAGAYRWRPPTNTPRYVGIRITKSAVGDASAKSATVTLQF